MPHSVCMFLLYSQAPHKGSDVKKTDIQTETMKEEKQTEGDFRECDGQAG